MLPELQDWIKYIAMDEDGTWTAFEEEPECVLEKGFWDKQSFSHYEEIEQEIFKPASDWRYSLIKVR